MDNLNVEEYVARLTNANWHVRGDAAVMLGKIGDVSAIPALIQALRDTNLDVRHKASIALGKIGSAAVPALSEVLKDKDKDVRWFAAGALGDIGGTSALSALTYMLKDKDTSVRNKAIESLSIIGVPAIPALITALKDVEREIRWAGVTWRALGQIGIPAVPALTEALKDKSAAVRSDAANALESIGDSVTLPRKILAASYFSAKTRIQVLERLRRCYAFPDTRTLCQTVLNEEDSEVCKGAQTVLGWLNGDRELLIGVSSDTEINHEELLRSAQCDTPEMHPETLLHVAEKPGKETQPYRPHRTFWKWLLGKR